VEGASDLLQRPAQTLSPPPPQLTYQILMAPSLADILTPVVVGEELSSKAQEGGMSLSTQPIFPFLCTQLPIQCNFISTAPCIDLLSLLP
jgi:hypothetical protein